MRHSLSFSSKPGRGSVFGVRVRRDSKARRARSTEAPPPVPNPGSLRGLRVLCVDNDTAILEGMEALLGQWGVQVVKARNSAEAVVLCTQSGIDTVLADYHLGDGVDGIELLRRLRAARTTTLTAALISADHDAAVALEARAAGLPLLHKPLRPAALRALLCAFRRQPRKASAA
jgi:CheY-like chemotaxis protein